MKTFIELLSKRSTILILSLVLLITAVLLSILIVSGVKKPIVYTDLKDKRLKETINRMKDIREIQKLYKEQYGYYTNSFDTLIKFVEDGQLVVIKAIGSIPDSLLNRKIKINGKTVEFKDPEQQALKMGIISRDTIKVFVRDTISKIRRQYIRDNSPFEARRIGSIPVGKKTPFVMDTATVIAGGIPVKVFQCYAMYDDILFGLDQQLNINEKATFKLAKKDDCDIYGWVKEKTEAQKDTMVVQPVIKQVAFLRVGKLNEAINNAGNWGE